MISSARKVWFDRLLSLLCVAMHVHKVMCMTVLGTRQLKHVCLLKSKKRRGHLSSQNAEGAPPIAAPSMHVYCTAISYYS